MSNENYNGWTNYATWRINLEIFDGFELDDADITAEFCEDYVYELLEMDNNNTLALSYAEAFINDVNWHEIAEHLNSLKEEG